MRQDTRRQEEVKFDKDVEQMPWKEHLQELLTHDIAMKIKHFFKMFELEEQ